MRAAVGAAAGEIALRPAPRWSRVGLWLLVLAALVLAALAFAFSRGAGGFGGAVPVAHRAATGRALSAYARLPLSFQPNVGQSAAPVRFLARAPGATLSLSSREAVLELAGTSHADPRLVRLQFPGAGHPLLSGTNRLPGKVNYFVGADRSRWHANVPTYASVRYAHLWPGIDASFYGNSSRLEYDLQLAPGADPRRIALRFSGARRERIDAHGALVLTLAGGAQVRELAPVAYQLLAGRRHVVASHYVLAGGVARIALGGYDRGTALTIDPAVVYSTYLGGNEFEQGSGVAVDSAGDAYIGGTTESTNFPVVGPAQGADAGNIDVVVSKLNPAGSALIYSTYLGGSDFDADTGIAVDSEGDAYVTGLTESTNFPTKSAVQSKNGGGKDAFVAKLDPAGSALVYSTYLGGKGDDEGEGIAVDAAGDAYIGGSTKSANFPTKNPEQASCGDSGCTEGDAFVTKLDPAGSALVYSTYIGGNSEDLGGGIAIDAAGEAFLTGSTISTNFPTKNALESVSSGLPDGFVTKLNAAGSALVYSTYLGGSGPDASNDIAVDSEGDAYVTGLTLSGDFPTKNAAQPSCGDPGCAKGDAFVSKLDPAGNALVYSTYLGGESTDFAYAVAVDPSGNAYVAGYTISTDFPTLNAEQPACGDSGCSQGDAFVTKIEPGGALAYSSYLGGSGKEQAYAIAVDHAGAAYVTGFTSSTTDFPTRGPLQPTYGGGLSDTFVTKLAPPDTTAPTSTAAIPVCNGPVTLAVTDQPEGSGPRAVRFRIDGGAEQTLATSGNPGVAAIAMPEGDHTLEYWGEDVAGNVESPHHVASVQIDTTPPALSITSDQGFSSYEIGDHASVTVTAHDATSGLVSDPSRVHAAITTAGAGHFNASISATDHCGNSTSASFPYTVIANPTFARNVNLETRTGHVTVKLPRAGAARAGDGSARGFAALVGARQVPVGTIVDASAGEVALTAASTAHGALQSATLSGGSFEVLQARAGHGLVELRLIDTVAARVCARAGSATRGLGLLRTSAKGRFRTRGRDAAATTGRAAAAWSIRDRCDGTLTAVTHGSVSVRDLRTNATKLLRTGKGYLSRQG